MPAHTIVMKRHVVDERDDEQRPVAADCAGPPSGVVVQRVVVEGQEDVRYEVGAVAGGCELGLAHWLGGDFEEGDGAGGEEGDVGFGELGELFAVEVSVEWGVR